MRRCWQRVTAMAFNQRRKMLRSSLKGAGAGYRGSAAQRQASTRPHAQKKSRWSSSAPWRGIVAADKHPARTRGTTAAAPSSHSAGVAGLHWPRALSRPRAAAFALAWSARARAVLASARPSAVAAASARSRRQFGWGLRPRWRSRRGRFGSAATRRGRSRARRLIRGLRPLIAASRRGRSSPLARSPGFRSGRCHPRRCCASLDRSSRAARSARLIVNAADRCGRRDQSSGAAVASRGRCRHRRLLRPSRSRLPPRGWPPFWPLLGRSDRVLPCLADHVCCCCWHCARPSCSAAISRCASPSMRV